MATPASPGPGESARAGQRRRATDTAVECRLITTRNVGTDRVDSGRILTTCFGGGLPPRDSGIVRDSPGTWTLVPEPATATLAGLGLTLLGFRKRRRTR